MELAFLSSWLPPFLSVWGVLAESESPRVILCVRHTLSPLPAHLTRLEKGLGFAFVGRPEEELGVHTPLTDPVATPECWADAEEHTGLSREGV